MLRAFQSVRGERPDPAFMADLAYVQHKDLDLSVRLAALLAFDVLLVTAGINPLAASPGSPLNLDAAIQPVETAAIIVGIVLLAWSAYLCVSAMLIGEEFTPDGLEDDREGLARRILAAYVASVDAQTELLRRAGRTCLGGGVVTGLACAWIVVDKVV